MTISNRQAVFLRDGKRCQYCGAEERLLPPSNPLTIDHIHPRSLGGSNHARNLLTACRICNSKRGTKSLALFVGVERAILLIKQTRKPIKKSGGRQSNKIHDLVRDLIEIVGELRPAEARNLRHRARTLGVSFEKYDFPKGGA